MDEGGDRESGEEGYLKSFTLYLDDREVYAKEIADALEADLQPLATSGLMSRTSKYDTYPSVRRGIASSPRASRGRNPKATDAPQPSPCVADGKNTTIVASLGKPECDG